MHMKKFIKYLLVLVSCTSLMTACNLDIAPADSLTGAQMVASPTGLVDILNGCYATMKDWPDNADSHNNWYGRQFYQMSDFSSDDVVYGHATTDELNFIFRVHERYASLGNVQSFWAQSYKIIYATNVALDVINTDPNPSAETKFLHGEALFLKAFCMHCLVRFYAKPYSAANASTLGIVIRENGSDSGVKGRATLQETYDYIENCLLDAEKLMSEGESNRASDRSFASIGAVRALLSRVYLYKGDWDKCISYCTKVIDDDNYQIADVKTYEKYFTKTYEYPEIIWCLRMLPSDDKESAAVASMIYKAEGCWGEEGYSESLLKDMGEGSDLQTNDVRWNYVCPVNPKNGLNLIPCSKLSNQDDKPTLFSPAFFRVSEMYLSRAEAYAHKGQTNEALKDVNVVRTNRMKENASKYAYTAADIETNIVDLVLKEKRVEFPFEGHRFFDLMRNGKDLVRDYWGFHTTYTAGQSIASKPSLSAEGIVIKNNDPMLVFPIPTLEINNNPMCEQNEGY